MHYNGGHMRGIPVLFNNNHYKLVSGRELDQLLPTGRVKAFRRSTGWVLIGHAPLRGKGGKFGKFRGPERRNQRIRLCGSCSKIKSQQVTEQKGRLCLICDNLAEEICVSTAFLDNYKEVDNYASQ